jgi:hypothetical protein
MNKTVFNLMTLRAQGKMLRCRMNAAADRYREILACALTVLWAALAASSASAQAARDSSVEIESADSTNLNRIGLSYRMGFNMSATFKGLGGFGALNPASHPLRTPIGDPFNYDNGYVYPDRFQHGGDTYYYGYVAGTPLRPADLPNEFDLYRSGSSANLTSRGNDGDPQHGFELTYSRQFCLCGSNFWRLEAGFGYMDLNIQSSQNLRGTVLRMTDTFQTQPGQVSAPLLPTPFSGVPGPAGPGGAPLVVPKPVSSTSEVLPGGASVNAYDEFDAQVFSFRVGPALDFPLSRRFTFSLSAGLLLLDVNSDFKYDETVSLAPSVNTANLPAERHHGSASNNDFLVGGYLGGDIFYALTERFRLMVGAEFQATDDYTQTLNGKTAVLNLKNSVFLTLGIAYSF